MPPMPDDRSSTSAPGQRNSPDPGAALQRLRGRIPPAIKLPYRHLVGSLPARWRYRRCYHETRALLRESQGWSREQLLDYQCRELASLVRHCYLHVPYYHRIMSERGLTPADIQSPSDLHKLPFLDKDIVRDHQGELLASNLPLRQHSHRSTGGTSGRPLSFVAHKTVSPDREKAFMDALWERVQVRADERLVVLRNNALPGARCWEYNPRHRRLICDPFKLSRENVAAYLGAIRRSGIENLHTYPSAAVTLQKLAEEAGLGGQIHFRVILASSENVYEGQRESLEGAFGARFFSWYGHSEQLVLAGECEVSPFYHVFPEYGILELIDEEGRTVEQPGTGGEIVGTGFNNPVMPFLRYRTGDYAEYCHEQGCACGRKYPLLTKVRGRWLQEMILAKDGGLISMTALNMHSEAFQRVRQFQFLQETPGEVEIRLVRGEGYADGDTVRLRKELEQKLGNSVRLKMAFVDDIPRTERGKHRFLEQRLPLSLRSLR
jgi:phenylacetate-CoA ligase